MISKKGFLITISGCDSTGKETQSKSLVDYLTSKGYKASLLHFPRYECTNASAVIIKYLNGDFGDKELSDPYFIGMLYALDRKESKHYLEYLLNARDFVICDRYILDNYAYTLSLIPKEKEKEIIALREWLCQLEYVQFKMPIPDLQIFLDLPPIEAKELLKQRQKSNKENEKDIYEQDIGFQNTVYQMFKEICKTEIVQIIRCYDVSNKILTKNEITNKIKDCVDLIIGDKHDKN